MFICKDCVSKKYDIDKQTVDISLKSFGPCEICETSTECIDIPTYYLSRHRKHTNQHHKENKL